jgi:WhiB family transcriptional regulator, redox-sensing transcriptional regulator
MPHQHAAWRLGISRRTVQRLMTEARKDGRPMTARAPQAQVQVRAVASPQMKGAACRGSNLHHGPDGERADEREFRVTAAKAMCAGCDVRPACLEYALSRPEDHGVWGGLDEDERKAERERRAQVAA